MIKFPCHCGHVFDLDVDKAAPPPAAAAALQSNTPIPMAQRNVAYAAPDLPGRLTLGTIPLQLFRPINVFVMMFVVVGHALFLVTVLITAYGLFFVAPI